RLDGEAAAAQTEAGGGGRAGPDGGGVGARRGPRPRAGRRAHAVDERERTERSKAGDVADARQPAGGVAVAGGEPGLHVGHGERVLDARERAVEDPVMAVDPAAVEDLEH